MHTFHWHVLYIAHSIQNFTTWYKFSNDMFLLQTWHAHIIYAFTHHFKLSHSVLSNEAILFQRNVRERKRKRENEKRRRLSNIRKAYNSLMKKDNNLAFTRCRDLTLIPENSTCLY